MHGRGWTIANKSAIGVVILYGINSFAGVLAGSMSIHSPVFLQPDCPSNIVALSRRIQKRPPKPCCEDKQCARWWTLGRHESELREEPTATWAVYDMVRRGGGG